MLVSASLTRQIGISYTGWAARNAVSATLFTVVGITNKMATVLINLCLWDNGTSSFGFGCLMLCIAAGTLYQQAPMRDPGQPLSPFLQFIWGAPAPHTAAISALYGPDGKDSGAILEATASEVQS